MVTLRLIEPGKPNQNAYIAPPPSASRKNPIICTSENRFFIANLLS